MTEPVNPASLSAADWRFLDAAVELAGNGLYSTTPNPRVGCLLVRDDQVLGRGYHQRAGGPHAEVAAIRDAQARARAGGADEPAVAQWLRGCTAYVSLEPCAFHSRTPPCVDALQAIGVARVVGALTDPHPRVAGAGYAQLRGAGIEVVSVELESARALNEGYSARISRGRPFVRLKVAASVDGRTAMASGESQWITGPEARDDVQQLRARSCAVITGRGTVAADNPQLNVRAARFALDGQTRQPLRVVLDSRAALAAESKVFQPPAEALWVHSAAASVQPSTAVSLFACGTDQVDLPALLTELAKRQCNEVLVEAGPTLIGQFLAQGLWDEAIVYLAPKFLGSSARPLAQLPLSRMAEGIEATIAAVDRVGGDLRLRLQPRSVSTQASAAD